MEVVILFNGLGNQMSQYAFYLAKKKRDKNVKVIFSPFSKNEHNGYELEKVFDINLPNNIITFILSFIYSFRKRPKIWAILCRLGISEIIESDNYNFNNSYLTNKRKGGITYYVGGWHSEKYYIGIESEIHNIFHFKEDKETIIFFRNIKNQLNNIVSVHVRRGDYVNHPMFGNISTLDYYKRGMDYMRSHLKFPLFIIISDDKKWCIENFSGNDIIINKQNAKNEAWKDMYLISKCNHHINSNSTFSWWGAWLGTYSDTTIIVPNKFINAKITNDIYPNTWIKL